MLDATPAVQLEEFNQAKFLVALILLDDKLHKLQQEFDGIAQPETGFEMNIYNRQKANIQQRARFKEEIFQLLAQAYNATDGEVCDWAQFNSAYTEAFINLSLPYSGHMLWAKVIKWMDEEGDDGGFYREIIIETTEARAKEVT